MIFDGAHRSQKEEAVTGVPRLCLLLLASLLLAPLTAQAQQTKLRVTLQLPITNHLGVNLVQFKEEVEKRTNKSIAVEIFDNSRLYKDNEVLEAVSSGAIEMATLTYQQFHKHVPAIDIFEQPFLMNFDALVRAATSPDGEFRKLLDKAILDATGVRVLWWQSYGNSVFFSKGRDTKHPTGISGQKIRVFGDNMATFTKYCGGVPMVISASKQNQAVKDGTVDMAMTGITGVDSRELWKVTDTITRTEHAALEFIVIINEKVWQSLSDAHKTIIGETSRMVEKDLRDKMAAIEDKAYAFAREKGMRVHELSPDEVAEWRVCSARLIEDYMASGGELASRLMGAYGRLRTDPCCNSGPQGAFRLR
jgi:C4-dicarboxylate-binding protein DctP